MKKKKVKKTMLRIICFLLALIVAFAAIEGFYYPRYLSRRHSVTTADNAGSSIKIISSNVRTFSPTDFFKKSWFYRADLLVDSLAEQNPDIIGFQEVTKMHYRYLCDTLSGYDNVITYRDNSLMPEACPIFYKQTKFNLVDKGSFWLSETPEKMSKDWGSECYRICSYVILENKSDGKQLVVFNTHLDHVSDEARIKGIAVVLEKIKQFGSLPSIIMGDFNATEDSETYRSATESFLDAKYQTKNTMTGATFQNFGKALDSENIDYFMISKEGIKVQEYQIYNSTVAGTYTSDHFPIGIVIELTA